MPQPFTLTRLTREQTPARKEYRKNWMRDWRRRRRAKYGDRRRHNGRNQLRNRGRFWLHVDDVREEPNT
jgi:hypothetical protein